MFSLGYPTIIYPINYQPSGSINISRIHHDIQINIDDIKKFNPKKKFEKYESYKKINSYEAPRKSIWFKENGEIKNRTIYKIVDLKKNECYYLVISKIYGKLMTKTLEEHCICDYCLNNPSYTWFCSSCVRTDDCFGFKDIENAIKCLKKYEKKIRSKDLYKLCYLHLYLLKNSNTKYKLYDKNLIYLICEYYDHMKKLVNSINNLGKIKK